MQKLHQYVDFEALRRLEAEVPLVLTDSTQPVLLGCCIRTKREFMLNAEPPSSDRRLLHKSLAGELGFAEFDPEAFDVLRRQ